LLSNEIQTCLKISELLDKHSNHTMHDQTVKAALSGLTTLMPAGIVSLPLTEFTPSSPEALHTKQA
jgi:hypothetical protein